MHEYKYKNSNKYWKFIDLLKHISSSTNRDFQF
jgi:hypothetical protein